MQLRSCYDLSAEAALMLRFWTAILDHFYTIGGLIGLAAFEHQPSKNMDRIVSVAMLQLAIMNRRLISQTKEDGRQVLRPSLVVCRQRAPIWTLWPTIERAQDGRQHFIFQLYENGATRLMRSCTELVLESRCRLPRPCFGLPFLTEWHLERFESFRARTNNEDSGRSMARCNCCSRCRHDTSAFMNFLLCCYYALVALWVYGGSAT